MNETSGKETTKRKKVLMAGAVSLIVILMIILLFSVLHRQEASIHLTQEVTVAEEHVDPEIVFAELPVTRKGLYQFQVNWQAPNPAFISGCVIKDQQGNALFAVTGNSVIAESYELMLTPQTYHVEIHYLINEELYYQFITDYILTLTEDTGKTPLIADFDPSCHIKDAELSIDYTIETFSGPNFALIGIYIGCIFTILFTYLLLRFTRTDTSMKNKFDERQQLVRGKGFQHGFCTMLVCNMILFLYEVTNAPQFMEPEVSMAISCLIGICTYTVYCIWNESYFALNRNRKRLMVIFFLIGALNFLISGIHFLRGTMIQDGKLTFNSVNLFCGILFVVIFASMLLKRVQQNRKDEQI